MSFHGTSGYFSLKELGIFFVASPIISIALEIAYCFNSLFDNSSSVRPFENDSIFSILFKISLIVK